MCSATAADGIGLTSGEAAASVGRVGLSAIGVSVSLSVGAAKLVNGAVLVVVAKVVVDDVEVIVEVEVVVVPGT